MKSFRLLLLVMAICLTSGVKAQFYDGPDDIYYYVGDYIEIEEMESQFVAFVGYRNVKTGKKSKRVVKDADVIIFNFDGKNATELTNCVGQRISGVKERLSKNPNYFEEKIETSDYDWKFVSSSSKGTTYQPPSNSLFGGTYTFSHDRNILIIEDSFAGASRWRYYKRVDKSYFKVGRSRTPSSTMHE